MKKILIAAALLVSAGALGQAADWPNWRGPDYSGISQETDWFEKWGSSGPKQLWDASVGTGFAAVSVADGRVFTMGTNRTATQFTPWRKRLAISCGDIPILKH